MAVLGGRAGPARLVRATRAVRTHTRRAYTRASGADAAAFWAPHAHLGGEAAAAVCVSAGLGDAADVAARVAAVQALLPETNALAVCCAEPEATLGRPLSAVGASVAAVAAAAPAGTDIVRLIEWQPALLRPDVSLAASVAQTVAARPALHGEALAVAAAWNAVDGRALHGDERADVVDQLCDRWAMAETQGVHWDMLREHFGGARPKRRVPRTYAQQQKADEDAGARPGAGLAARARGLGAALRAMARNYGGGSGQWDPRETYKAGEGFGDIEKRRGY